MAKTNNLTDFLTDLADGIRAKKGTSGAINPQDFRSEIESIETGTDTSDATATEDKVFLNETFYAGGEKKTGTFTIASEISSQDGLISAIKTALQGKASGGGGESPTALLDALLTNTLTSIDSDITSIVAYACRGLSKLKTVNLPNVTSIGTYAFYYCTSMTSINAPKTKTLGTYAFYNCGGLTSVNFPLATAISQNCLYSCDSLKKADFGVAATINQAGLAYCSSLEALILRKSDGICKLATATNALQGSAIANGTGYVYVPKAFLSDDDATMDYRRATNWSNYAAQFRAIEDYPEITGG